MGRAQCSYNHRHYAQGEGYVKGQVYPMQEECQGRRELAHPTAIDKDLHHRRYGDRTQGEWEDNGNAEHLAGIIQHTENTCRRTSRMWLNRTHDGIGIGRDKEAGPATH